MSEADGVYVLDTGSEDDTVKILRDCGAHVECESIVPWRFDTARNRSLELVPEDGDLCVCTDLDERFRGAWREKMESAMLDNVTQLRYRYTWSFESNGGEGVVFWIEKAHARHGFKWVNPVHEVIVPCCGQPACIGDAPGVQLDHFPDSSKSRGQYLPLLELAVKENPDNDRNMHYLGREYMYKQRWEDCVRTLKRHLALPGAVWPDERAASMRYISKAEMALGHRTEAEQWLLRAAAEAPHLREAWVEAAELAYIEERWIDSLYYAERALKIKNRSRSYINEGASWGEKPHDLAAIAAYNLGLYELAFEHGTAAAELAPDDQRIARNLEFYHKAKK